MDRTVPGIVIAGTASGVGKSTIVTGIMGALRRRGLAVQPFKIGPDYIDPTYHTSVCRRASRNLDSWMLRPETLRELYARAVASADIAVVEGVMGLFDGHDGSSEVGSSAEVAKLLGLPVLLVVDVSKMARSAAAMVLGYQRLDPQLSVVGVIANGVGSPGHLQMVTKAIEGATGLPMIGSLPRRPDLQLSERHLGLIPTTEGGIDDDFFERVVGQVQETVDLNALQRLATQAKPVSAPAISLFPTPAKEATIPIAIARDEAFGFYYQDNLDLLSAWGAQLVSFSPLHDVGLPAGSCGLYLGGGFPELFAPALAENRAMLSSIRAAHAKGMPIYAECGGLMYLCQSMTSLEGERYEMAGLLPAHADMREKRLVLSYHEVRALGSNILLEADQTARGHEFHWSSLDVAFDRPRAAYELVEDGRLEGYQQDNLLASYVHLHFASQPHIAKNLASACARWEGCQCQHS